ncbi:MFS transporter [Rhodoferax saidenbachensis]|uniref:MFS transporter n=1 Tax=Rhodoferax saidenbachensis TaxID=1484693 RepID=A0A1P8KEL7_9BURK|nr:MFS transporter [Rhodoferax saidenbachensis]APW44464.1 MFS transporter [Rhodoferax saidenbachensis]
MRCVTTPTAMSFTWRDGWRYGLLGLPLAFVALPLYVILPNHYARAFGVPLATLGAVLLLARLFDAFIDPLLGRWSDRLFARSPRTVLGWAAVGAVLLFGGFALLFFPPVQGTEALVLWATACLMLTYAAYSLLSITHQSWGAMLGGDEAQRSRVVAWREGLGLVGVILASIAPVALGLPAATALFFIALFAGWWAWTRARQPRTTAQSFSDSGYSAGQPASIWLPFTRPAYRALLSVFVVNGIASAVPATLILFFVQDRLQAPASAEPLFLGSYFLSAALAIPLWLQVVKRIGLARTWGVGMLLSIAVFVFAAGLGAGDTTAFIVVCALSGVALGTDLAIPGALLAGTIDTNGDRGRMEGAYFGWWNFAIKLNLALAAGVALPALGLLGYTPGTRDPQALQVLTLAYCLLPCALKALAAVLLYTLILRKTP